MSDKLTTEEFIKKAKEIHGDKYDYSLSEVKGVTKKIKIICPKHGEFDQIPYNHLKGAGCKNCSLKTGWEDRKKSTEDFIKKAKEVHGDKYDYSQTEYTDSKSQVKIIDEDGFEHLVLPFSHLKDCLLNNKSAINKNAFFVNKLKQIHGDKYDYSLVKYEKIHDKIKIICSKHGEFSQSANSHFKGHGCPKCSGENSSINQTYSTETFISKAIETHGNKYDYSLVKYVDSKTKVKIICPVHGEFEQAPSNHLLRDGCRKCSFLHNAKKRSKSTEEFIKKAKEIHGDKYNYSKTEYINYHSEVRIICQTHGEFMQNAASHLSGKNCPKCSNVYKKTAEEFINEAKLIHGNAFEYSKVNYKNSTTKVSIICPIHGEFEQIPVNHLKGGRCPKCVGIYQMTNEEFLEKIHEVYGDKYDYSKVQYFSQKSKILITDEFGFEHILTAGDALKNQQPSIRTALDKKNYFIHQCKLVHGDKYDYSKVEYLTAMDKIIIICPIHGEFFQTPNSHLGGSGCQICNGGWLTINKLNLLNLLEYSDLLMMDPIELSVIIGQGNIPIDFRPLVHTDANSDERIATLQELRERFEEGDDGNTETEVDAFIHDIEANLNGGIISDEESEVIDDVDSEITSTEATQEPRLPIINPTADLRSLDNSLYATMDEEAIDSLVQYKLRKLWNTVLNNQDYTEELRNETGGKYFEIIKDLFFDEYNQVINYAPPTGYSFKHTSGEFVGHIALPNLMQKLTVHRLLKNKSYGNWSGTGAGKTLSFIIASREIDAKITLIVALNSTIKQTCKTIKSVYPDSVVFSDYQDNFIFDRTKHNYIVLNYEKFQQEYSEELCQSLTNNNQIDFVVIDEVHNAKQREEDNESQRREVLNRLFGRIREKNLNLYTLVMSATPVINNLFEAKSLLTLMTGLEYNDLNTRKNLPNALNMFRQLILNGLRFIPKYEISVNELTGQNMTNLSVTANHLLDQLLALAPKDIADIEKLLLPEKLELIRGYIRKGVVIYTYFTTDIVNEIESFVHSLGFTTGTYTGEESPYFRDKNLADFIDGKIDVLIGSKPIGTGVDGLQDICDRMLVITLPWTDSEYTQLKGRIYRQGSPFDNVEFIIPQVKIELGDNEIWSWDIQRLNLIKHKKTLADAAVDGIIPSRIMPQASTMFRKSQESLRKWKERIESGNIIENSRNSTQINLYPEISDNEERQRRVNSELSEFNRRGKTLHSTTMHKEFTDNPESWHRYHALRNDRMKDWSEIPYEYIATKIRNPRLIVADFGCGENKMKHCIPNNKVYGFDHIACDDSVTACDISDVSQHLANESVDVAVYSLALWGTNFRDYVKEAYRVLAYSGVIHIAEPAKNYETPESEEELINLISEVGFKVVGKIERRDKFIYITGIKM